MSDLADIAAALPNGSVPLPDVVTAGQPSASQIAALASAGVKTVLDLRGVEEARGFDEPSAVRAGGLDYVSLAMGYEGVPDTIFDTVRDVLGDAARRPVLLHCASANRVGAALLPHLVLDHGVDRNEALERAVAVGLRHRGIAQAALDYVARKRGA